MTVGPTLPKLTQEVHDRRGPAQRTVRVRTPRQIARAKRYQRDFTGKQRDFTGKQRARRSRAVPATGPVRRNR